MEKSSRRPLLIGSLVAAGVLAAGGTAFALTSIPSAEPSAAPTTSAPSATPTPTPTPTPVPEAFPASAPVFGLIDGWTGASHLAVASVLPQVGDAADGDVSVFIDAPVLDAETAVLETTIAVEPGVVYDVSLQTRVASLDKVDVPAVVAVPGGELPIPASDALWQPVEGTFTADADTARIAIVLRGPIEGLGIDDIVVSPQSDPSANIAPNPSFEQVGVEDRIVNRSLVLPAGRAVLAVSGAEGDATWTVTNDAGEQVATGTHALAGSVSSVPLTGVGQGYYTASVTDAAGTTTETTIAVIDMPEGEIPLDGRFGVGLHVENDYYADAAHLTASLGIGLARNDILWGRNERDRGVYDFQPYYTDSFDALHVQGIHILGIVNYGNALYGDKNVPSNPEAIAAYGRYATAIAERFDLIGLEVFNEFNHERFNKAGCGTDPTCYVPLLQTVRDSVHAVDPDLPIVAGSTANYDGEWFNGLWRAGGLPLSDAVSYHPYQVTFDAESLGGIVQDSYANMQAIAGDTRPVWITELGMTSTPAGLTLQGQADFALRATLIALSNGVEKYFWYDLINDDIDPNDHEGNFGLFYQERAGVAALPPKPSAYAYGLLISQLSGLELTGNDTAENGVFTVEFADDEGRAVTAAWAPSGSGEWLMPTDEAVQVTGFGGATTEIESTGGTASVPVTGTPVFVHHTLESATESEATATPSPSPTQD